MQFEEIPKGQPLQQLARSYVATLRDLVNEVFPVEHVTGRVILPGLGVPGVFIITKDEHILPIQIPIEPELEAMAGKRMAEHVQAVALRCIDTIRNRVT